MNNIFKGKKIFITGAGSIGSEILKQIIKYDIDSVRVYDNSELKLHNLKQEYGDNQIIKYIFGDIRDKNRLSIAMREVDIIFHTAAMKHVSVCESNPVDSVLTNVLGTQNIIDMAIQEECEKLINISTDKAASPINVMGATKLLSERLVVSASQYKGDIDTIFTNVRFGNVFGSSGSVVPIFKELINNNKNLTITDKDMTRFIMSIDSAVNLIFKSSKLSRGDDIFILKMPSMRIIDLANAMIEKYNSNSKIDNIGMQTMEKMNEILLTNEESKLAYDNDELIVIPSKKHIEYFKEHGFKKLETNKLISNNNHFLSIDEIKEMLDEN